MTIEQASRRSGMKRGKFAVSVDPASVERIDELVTTGVFRSRSHGFDEALRRLIAEIESETAEEVGA